MKRELRIALDRTDNLSVVGQMKLRNSDFRIPVEVRVRKCIGGACGPVVHVHYVGSITVILISYICIYMCIYIVIYSYIYSPSTAVVLCS